MAFYTQTQAPFSPEPAHWKRQTLWPWTTVLLGLTWETERRILNTMETSTLEKLRSLKGGSEGTLYLSL